MLLPSSEFEVWSGNCLMKIIILVLQNFQCTEKLKLDLYPTTQNGAFLIISVTMIVAD
jgi:hypothetical protein